MISILKANIYTSGELLKLLNEKNSSVSQRQLQRDLKSIEEAILTDHDQLKNIFTSGHCLSLLMNLSVFILLTPHALGFISKI
ncbi:hypothetical protein P700755_001832 [Psychroflexus torquis ATCC 700755]|uniref:Uncharacterized protein n=1 Tax=Psychroflexus torquis (strain ATCC 700755 / CIP 106069 / ACAM 623) TaxID=313595 RepID=K4IHX2_PSYTT|nr:hypothetical protein [Psychroflexus torquis]AFU68666.1 hypothetical protein P700755_001832 [Psychroflexus torquis ATCC 700755]